MSQPLAGVAPVQVFWELIALVPCIPVKLKIAILSLCYRPSCKPWRISFRMPGSLHRRNRTSAFKDRSQLVTRPRNYTVFLKRLNEDRRTIVQIIAIWEVRESRMIDLGGIPNVIGQLAPLNNSLGSWYSNPVEKKEASTYGHRSEIGSLFPLGIHERHLEVDGRSFSPYFDSATSYR